MRKTLAAAVALCLGVGVNVAVPEHAEAGMSREKRKQVMRAVVRLVILKRRGTRLVPIGNGSGTILTKDGLILTNNHVVSNVRSGQVHDAIAVTVTRSFDKKPQAVCLAEPSRAIRNPTLDLAVIKCERELNGRPLRRRINWPTAALGTSKKLIPGDELYIVGYPAVAGATITFTAGKVSGFLDDKRRGGARAWIKTDALISPGVSGGAAFNANGDLIGVPTLLRYRRGGRTTIGLARPVFKARPLLAKVIGKNWASIPRAPTGPKRYANVMPRVPGQPRGGPPVGQHGVPRGMRDYSERGRRGQRGVPYRGGAPGAGTQRKYPNYPPGYGRRGAQPPSHWRQPRPRSSSSWVAGVVVDAGTMQPVPGAVILIVRPGIRVRSINRSNIRRYMADWTRSNSAGVFRSRRRLFQGKAYGVVVKASGYRLLAIDRAINLYSGAPPLLNIGRVILQGKNY